jgi:tartrate/fumarate subfamily iron-sulfur-dependent hydro-lyase alpha chain
MNGNPKAASPRMGPLPSLIFASRWLQLPLYLGLILAQCVYVFHFWVELVHLIEAAFGNKAALAKLVTSIGYKSTPTVPKLNETIIMLVVLALIDVVMISNLLIMVIVGGYETFVSRLNLEGHPDQPEWLSHVNASVLKVKLATAIIGISSIHLLKTFINAAQLHREGAAVADGDPRRLPVLGAGHRLADRLMSGTRVATDREQRKSLPVPDRGVMTTPLRHRRPSSSRSKHRRAAVHQLLPPGRLHRPPGRAYEREQSPAAKDAIAQILTNSRMCAEGRRPICQDTGIVNVFLKVGMDVRWEGFGEGLQAVVNEGVRRGYLNPDNVLRASVLDDPSSRARTRKDNTPAVLHVELVPGDTLDVTVAAKGGGSENKSKVAMLNPSDDIVDWVLKTVPTMGAGWCPPGMLGIGVGGTAEKAMLLAKQALMDDIDMSELLAARSRRQARGAAHRAVREGQRAGHRRAGPGRADHGARREDRTFPTHAAPASRSR